VCRNPTNIFIQLFFEKLKFDGTHIQMNPGPKLLEKIYVIRDLILHKTPRNCTKSLERRKNGLKISLNL
jgi:hypothetical protein